MNILGSTSITRVIRNGKLNIKTNNSNNIDNSNQQWETGGTIVIGTVISTIGIQ